MNFKCKECGHIFEEGEQKVVNEFIAEAWGRPIFQERSYCPVCGSDNFEETVTCECCGGSFLEEEMYSNSGYCMECAKDKAGEYKYNPVGCYRISRVHDETETVQIDAFLASMFTPERINEILYKEMFVSMAVEPVDCTPFIKADESWFIDAVIEEVKKNENCKK